MDFKLAECVGLWLAEGDNKTKSEITFTNNCWDLIKLFYGAVIRKYAGNPRIYAYSKDKAGSVQLGNCRIKYYIDKRARKPYFILRLASVVAINDWQQQVKQALSYTKHSQNVLRGFFAGEGNVKHGAHGNKCLRIAQKMEKPFINKMLHELGISYRYSPQGRSYEITGKWNWDIFAKYNLADLHPDKKERFWRLYGNFKEAHYPALYLKNSVFGMLARPRTASELSKTLCRTQARICDVLIELKKEGKITNYRIRSKDYWTKEDTILISNVKAKYLKLLGKGLTKTSDFAHELKVTWKSANRRLKELEKLGLVKLNSHGWRALAKTNVAVI